MVDCNEQDISFGSKGFANRLAQADTLVNDGDLASAHDLGVGLKRLGSLRRPDLNLYFYWRGSWSDVMVQRKKPFSYLIVSHRV